MGKRDHLRRRPAFRQPLPRMLIVCEGTRTEPGYFQAMRHLERSLIELEISPGGTPKTLVERAAAMKRAAGRAARTRQDLNMQYEEVWCVFDVDEHPFLPEAKQQARDNQIEVAVSNPCFELWMMLHFREQRAHIDRAVVPHELKAYLPGYEKEVPCDQLHASYHEATRRAQELDAWQEARGCKGENPSTGVYKLTERIRDIGRKRD